MSFPEQTVCAIAADNVVKAYPGGVRALDGLSFTVEPGQLFGLLGPNGAGKSSTMKILTTPGPPRLRFGACRRTRRTAPT
jgi:ABC-type multidrug transport system ATPase subunit